MEMVQCLSLLQAHCAAKGLSCIRETVNNMLWGCAGKKDALVNKQQFSDELLGDLFLYKEMPKVGQCPLLALSVDCSQIVCECVCVCVWTE